MRLLLLSLPVSAHDLQRLNAIESRAGGLGDKANLRLAPRRDFRMTRQIGVDMGVNDAVGIVLQYFKLVHDAVKTGGLHFGLHKRVFAALRNEWVNIAPLGQREGIAVGFAQGAQRINSVEHRHLAPYDLTKGTREGCQAGVTVVDGENIVNALTVGGKHSADQMRSIEGMNEIR